MPSDYGTIALLNVFLAVCQTFIDSGFGLALMRKKDCTEQDFNTVFIFSTVVALFCYGVLWIIAPWIAKFYNQPILVPITQIVSLNVIINALANVPNARLSISLDFKKKAYVTLVTVVISGCVGLWMAYSGLGIWSLVYQTLIAGAIRTILLFVYAKWLPKLQFSKQSFNSLFAFGSKMLVSGIIGNIYNNLSSIIIGKFYTTSLLGLFGKATTLASYPSMQMTGVILNVAYPTLAKIQDDEQRLIEAYRKMLRMATFVVFPLMVGLVVVARPFVLCVLGNKWADMIPFLQILCLSFMWDPINGMNMNLLQVKGFSNLYLKLDIIKKVIGFIVLCATIPLGIKAICIGLFIVALTNIPINTFYTQKLFGYGFYHQIKDIAPILVHTMLMALAVAISIHFIHTPMHQLIFGVLIGILYYAIVSYLLRFEECMTLLNILSRTTSI